ncbi:MAG TPA: carbonic anhydrase [Candidatus Sulfotelmatobacter sp.]|nr:carbonic anhydrase [Candidatus Sulfotelmatobacter sp.]
MEPCKRLLLANRAWVAERLKIDTDFFTKRVKTQVPGFLWIGCSDSRVPSEEITGAEPGELFVHRNVANIVVPTDVNMLSVVQYAVEVLNIQHIIVCGHYNCGGVKSAMTTRGVGPINLWLQPLRDLYGMNREEIDSVADEQGRWDRLVEINVRAQVRSLAKTSIIQHAWQRQQGPAIHGWVYDLRTGYLSEQALMSPEVKNTVVPFEDHRRVGT